MQLVFLGTSSGAPTRARNVTSMALRLPESREVWLFDCGEATQHQLLRSQLSPSQIRRIFITHLHGDHVFGLPGLIASMGLAGDTEDLTIFGPRGLRDFLTSVFRATYFRPGFPLRIEETACGDLVRTAHVTVSAKRLAHNIPTFGYRVEEETKAGHLDPEKALALGVPAGPLFGALKRGEDVVLGDGRVVHGTDVCGAPIPGRKVAFVTDTTPCSSAIDLALDADVLVHEATYGMDQAEVAPARAHSTTHDAAHIALQAGARLLMLTHISPRYAPGNPRTADDLLSEARTIFPNAILAHDLMIHDIKARG